MSGRLDPLVTSAALGVWLAALAWMAWSTLAVPSPARDVRFVGAEGDVDPGSVDCHGPLVADGRYLWQGCIVSDGEDGQSHLVRFDLERGIAQLGGAAPDTRVYGIARVPDGVVAIAEDRAIVHRRSSGELRVIGSSIVPLAIGVVNGAVEVVDREDGIRIQRYEDGRWSERHVQDPQPEEGQVVRAEAAWVEDGRWRFVWTRTPWRIVAFPADVVLLEGSETAPPAPVHTVSVEGRPLLRRNDGTTELMGRWLLVPAGGVLGSLSGSVQERGERGWSALEAPASPRLQYAQDGVIGSDGNVRPVLRTLDDDETQVRSRDGWVRLSAGDPVALAGPDGREGPPLASRFWLSIGFRLLPDPSGGYWAMGSLGESYVHIDDRLARDDELSFGERFARLFREDRAKRNSDVLDGPFAGVRVGSVLVLPLLPLLLMAVVVAARKDRKRWWRTAALVYLAAALVFGYSFYHMLRYYW